MYSTGFVDTIVTCVDLTEQLGIFCPCILIYFPNLKELDITGCISIDSELFTDCLPACTNLQKLLMKSCLQFSEYKIVKIATQVMTLEESDVANTSPLSFWNFYVICSTLQSLRTMDFTPKNISHLHEFKCTIGIFCNVHFGINIMRYFPFYPRKRLCEE